MRRVGRTGWKPKSGECGFCLLIFFPLKLTQPTLICSGSSGGSEVGKWWNVEGTYLESGGEGEWGGRGGVGRGGGKKSNTFEAAGSP